MSADVETVIIGAGAVGLAIARALCRAGQEVLVIERHALAGSESSSRNSQVVHAGLYYPPESWKAQLCRQGHSMMMAFVREHDVSLNPCGKLIVASSDDEIPHLATLAANAAANGVDGLRQLTGTQATALEPQLACVGALLSPSTSVIDSRGYITALEAEIVAAGGAIAFNHEVIKVSQHESGEFVITAVGSDDVTTRLTSRNLIAAAGLHATQVGLMLPCRLGYQVPQTYFAKGHYYALAGAAPFSHLIYPLPSLQALGIHATHFDGTTLFGPDIEWVNVYSYAFDDADGARMAAFAAAIKRYWPALPDGALHPAYTGLRPKLAHAREPAQDFALHTVKDHGIDRLVALYGIESPGLTASLAIGDWVARHFAGR